jgi:dihydroorotase
MDLLLRGGRVIDPASRIDRRADVLVVDGRIAEIGPGLRAPSKEVRELDVGDRIVAPGFVDLHVHLREPGQEYKEDIGTGGRAAVAGGFTTVCAMPNTTPPNDSRAVTELMVRRAREVALARVRPIGAISKGLAGESLAEMGEMKEAGIVAVSDDGNPVMNAELMRRALEYARTFDLPVVQHAEDLNLSRRAPMNEGPVSTRIGLRGQPPCAETVMVARDLELCAWTGARYHVAHISVGRTAEMVREARRRGLPVTCEVTPHHLVLTDEACEGFDTRCKCAPPLRSAADRDALREALADGTIDAIATDHAPHSPVEKELEFDHAAFGIIGLETALPLVLQLVTERVIDLPRAIELLTIGPARVFGLDREGVGALAAGSPADLTVLDPDRPWTIEGIRLRSRSKNTPFAGWEVRGRAILTLVAGRIVHDEDEVISSSSPLDSSRWRG